MLRVFFNTKPIGYKFKREKKHCFCKKVKKNLLKIWRKKTLLMINEDFSDEI